MKSIAKISHVEIVTRKYRDAAEYKVAYGLIKDDKSNHGNHPFPDGSEIRTSEVMDVVTEEGVQYIVTANSVYEVIGDIQYVG